VHKSQHATGGSDALAITDIGGLAGTEGTWTPVVTPQFGAFTTCTVQFAEYQKTGKFVTVNLGFTISNLGTGTGAIFFTLPPNLAAVRRSIIPGLETTLNGKVVRAVAEGTSAFMSYFDNSVAWVNGVVFILTGTFKVA